MCLRTLKPLVRTQWAVLPIPQVLVSFITHRLVSSEEKNSRFSQELVFTRGDPDIEETVISDCENEPQGLPEDMEGADRTPTSVRPMPENVQGGYLNRTFSTPYGNSESVDNSEDAVKDTDVYEPEKQM